LLTKTLPLIKILISFKNLNISKDEILIELNNELF